MPTLRFPLVGSYTNRSAGNTNEQVFTNCFPEVAQNPVTGNRTPKLLKRLGYTKGSALTGVDSALTDGAITAWTGATSPRAAVAAFLNTGGTSTSVWDIVGNAKVGGDIASTKGCSVLAETDISGTGQLVGNFFDSSTGDIERWFRPDAGAWTQVTDGDFPAASLAGRPAFMDGYTFDMTRDGKIYNSDLNSLSAYTATSFISVNDYPDGGISVARLGNYIVGFGTTSIQLFYNAGNATGSVLSRVQGSTINMGAGKRFDDFTLHTVHIQTVLPAQGTVYWIGTNQENAVVGVFRFKGIQPEKVSNVAIDNLLMDSQLYGFIGTLSMHGMKHIAMRGPAGVWCYCIETGFWWKHLLVSGEMTACLGGTSSSDLPSGATYFVGTNNARGNTSGTDSGWQDDGSNFTQTVRTEEMDLGTQNRKFYEGLRVDYDRQSAASNLAVSYSDDGGSTFSTARNIDMSTVTPGLSRLGSSRRRIWKFENTANTASGIKAVDLNYSVGQT